jgi:hypothetical protein
VVAREKAGHGKQSFRKWLVARVQGTQYAIMDIHDEELDAVAVKVGVQPDVLLEARLNALQAKVATGVRLPSNKRDPGSYYQYEMLFPEVVFYAWKAEAERRGLDGSALLRSAIHAYLIGSWEPEETTRYWVWRGIGYAVRPGDWKAQHGTRYPFRERAAIPEGVRRALFRRADRRGIPTSVITRSLCLAIIDGTWGSPGTLKIVDSTTMFDDENRYYLGE